MWEHLATTHVYFHARSDKSLRFVIVDAVDTQDRRLVTNVIVATLIFLIDILFPADGEKNPHVSSSKTMHFPPFDIVALRACSIFRTSLEDFTVSAKLRGKTEMYKSSSLENGWSIKWLFMVTGS